MKKFLAIVLSVALFVTSFYVANQKLKADDGMSWHNLTAAASREGNPLKGFMPYNESDGNIAHSLEWYYIAVKDVQTGMNSFDWTKLENILKKADSRGHQVIFRFYYDYPGEGNGVPQFLIDGGLNMRYYNEPNDLGGSGQCPDYSNQTFRTSMVNLITAMGEQYDGDPRIAYITAGLLGFWGEWHNWPYDEDTSDGKPDWSIPTAVYKEVTDAFTNSFKLTKILVREPKPGINFANYNVGYHDDSYCYATLTMANGGQDWSFMQKMKNAGLMDAWKRNCIGGEIYPPIQRSLFSNNPSGDCQSWSKCLEESHATWMLFEGMNAYSGEALNRVKAASKELGYDLRVNRAKFSDTVTSGTISVDVEMKNIGVAPFYYGHEVWPVEIGVKQNGNVVKTWTTDWDLSAVPADASNKTFGFEADHGLANGSYTLCMKVKCPSDKNILGFANAEQNSDGWLTLGNMTVNKQQTTQQQTTTKQTTQHPTTTKQTTQPPTTTRQATTVAAQEGVEINGYQISSIVQGLRCVYTTSDKISGRNVVERGLIFGIGDKVSDSDLYVGSNNSYVKSYQATDTGRIGKNYSTNYSTVASSYAMTMKFAAFTANEFNNIWKIRAYAKNNRGDIVYSNVKQYTISRVAASLYDNNLMTNSTAHNYLYDTILKKVNPNYSKIEFNRGNGLVQ